MKASGSAFRSRYLVSRQRSTSCADKFEPSGDTAERTANTHAKNSAWGAVVSLSATASASTYPVPQHPDFGKFKGGGAAGLKGASSFGGSGEPAEVALSWRSVETIAGILRSTEYEVASGR
jgi:hypothetical protein